MFKGVNSTFILSVNGFGYALFVPRPGVVPMLVGLRVSVYAPWLFVFAVAMVCPAWFLATTCVAGKASCGLFFTFPWIVMVS